MSQTIKNKNHKKNISHNELIERKNKFLNMKKKDFIFPDYFQRNTNIQKIHQAYQQYDTNKLQELNIYVSIAGRMIQRRIMGKASFCTLQNIEGKIQIYVNEKNISSHFYNTHFKKWDIGDILGITGSLFKTRTGELSIYCKNIKIPT